MLPLLEKRLADANLPAAQRARVVDIIATSDDDREIHATGAPFQVTAGTKGVGCEAAAIGSSCG